MSFSIEKIRAVLKLMSFNFITFQASQQGFIKRTKKVLNVMFFYNKGAKGRKCYNKVCKKDVVLRKLKMYYKTFCPKKGIKHLRLLHDNAPAPKAHLVT